MWMIIIWLIVVGLIIVKAYQAGKREEGRICLLYTSPSPRDS